jgi:hypothetical protein
VTYQSFADSSSGSIAKGYGLFSNPTPQTANGTIFIGSWTDPVITKSGNTLVIPQGYLVQLIASFYTERATGTTGSNFCKLRWYDETNTQYIGARANVNAQWASPLPLNFTSNAALAFVDTSAGSITVSCRMEAISATAQVNISGSRLTTFGSQSWLAAITTAV